MTTKILTRETISTQCTVTVRHTEETLEAHVELDDGLLPTVGDRITVFGEPIQVDYGRTVQFRRDAHLTRGCAMDKFWTKFRSLFDMTELYEVSFSSRRF